MRSTARGPKNRGSNSPPSPRAPPTSRRDSPTKATKRSGSPASSAGHPRKDVSPNARARNVKSQDKLEHASDSILYLVSNVPFFASIIFD